MQVGTCAVTGEKRDLGEAQYPVFDTVDEALTHDKYGLGSEKLLELLNAQVKTNAMNALRTAKTKGPTKSILRSEATNEIFEEFGAGAHKEIIGDKMALEALIAKRMAEIEARMKEAAGGDDSEEE